MSVLEPFAPASLSLRHWKEDLVAGTIVAVAAIPLCLGLAVASGVPPVFGLYTSVISGVLVALFGGVELGVTGPAAAMSVLLFSIVAKHGVNGLLVAGFLAGLMQIGMGLTGIGRVVKFIPYVVVVGFTTGIGLLLVIGQLGALTAVKVAGESTVGKLLSFVSGFSALNVEVLGLGVGTLAFIFLLPRISKRIPASFAGLVLGSGVVLLAGVHLPNIGSVPAGLPPFSVPDFNPRLVLAIFPSAFAIALLGSIESLLSAVAMDGLTGTKHSSSKELTGQGLANAVLPFFSGIPATGVIVRSATNVKNGAKTRLSAIIHSVVLLSVLLLLAPLASLIPLAVLAGILCYTAYHLLSFDQARHFLADSRGDFAVFVATVGATVFLDLTTAILIGFTLAGLAFMKKMSDNVEVELVPHSTPASMASTLAPDLEGIARTYRVSGPLFFGSANELEKISDETPEAKTPALVLDLLEVTYLDSSAIAILASIIAHHQREGEVYLAVRNRAVLRKIENSEIRQMVPAERFVYSVEVGLELAKSKYGRKHAGAVLPFDQSQPVPVSQNENPED